MSIPSLAEEVGVAFIICYWGGGLALGFKTDPRRPDISKGAVERCLNWAFNMGVSKGDVCRVYDRSSIAYVYTNHADLLKGLIAQFRAEAIMRRELPPLVDEWPEDVDAPLLEYDESGYDRLATERAHRFMAERIEYEPFLSTIHSIAPVYGVGHMARAGAAD